MTRVPPEERFWKFVAKTDGCWEWQGALSAKGYGMFTVVGTKPIRPVKAHRYSYVLAYGSIPDGLYICHHCDNKRCVRPDHLYAGTAKQNLADAIARGQFDITHPNAARGEKHPRARLTDAQVIEIRQLATQGVTQAELSRRFHVSDGNINSIIKRRMWKHL